MFVPSFSLVYYTLPDLIFWLCLLRQLVCSFLPLKHVDKIFDADIRKYLSVSVLNNYGIVNLCHALRADEAVLLFTCWRF